MGRHADHHGGSCSAGPDRPQALCAAFRPAADLCLMGGARAAAGAAAAAVRRPGDRDARARG